MNRPLPCYLPASIALLWLWSGLQPVLAARETSLQLLHAVGIAPAWQLPLLLAASLLDIAFGLLCFSRMRRQPLFWLAQLATVGAYSLIIAFRLPENWLHPFAPLLKNLPIAALIFYIYQQTRKIS